MSKTVSDMQTAYDAGAIEPGWYARWEKAGLFTANATSPKPKFTMCFPPPNITGELHMGHALQTAIYDLIARYKPEELPPALTSYVKNRAGYDYQQHCEVDSSNSKFVSDEVVDRFCLVGSADAHRKKLQALARVGVTQFNVYLMSGEEEDTLAAYEKEILPAFKQTARV